jgi:hypothetical protein
MLPPEVLWSFGLLGLVVGAGRLALYVWSRVQSL